MKEQLVSFQVAKLAKEKYFEEPCIFWYDNNEKLHNHQESGIFNTSALIDKNRGAIGLNNECNVPTQSVLRQWIQDTFNIYIELIIDGWGDNNNVSKDNLCYRAFIWEIGKPKPSHNDDLGAGDLNKILDICFIEILKNRV